MTTPRKPRRAVMAELLLTGSPSTILAADDRHLTVYFDTFAELREWLTATGLDSPDLLGGEHHGTTDDGRPYRSLNAYPTWHGWEVCARVVEYPNLAPLDADAAARLTDLAEVA